MIKNEEPKEQIKLTAELLFGPNVCGLCGKKGGAMEFNRISKEYQHQGKCPD